MAENIHLLFREFVVPGEILVAVKGGAHMSGYAVGDLTELGLAEREIKITPYYQQTDIVPTGFGGVACDVAWRLAYVDVTLGLIHYDQGVMEVLLDESAAGGGIRWGDPLSLVSPPGRAGTLAPSGKLLGGRRAMYESGNHFFSVNLIPPSGVTADGTGTTDPYRFRMCHLAAHPATVPMGTDVQVVEVTFRALPYQDPYRSGVYSGAVLLGSDGYTLYTPGGGGGYELSTSGSSTRTLSTRLPPLPFARPNGATLETVGAPGGPPGGKLINDVMHSRRREILGSGAVLYDRTPDVSGVIG